MTGRNGTGKTTLLKAVSSYEITGFPRHLKVVHVEQDPVHDLGATPLATVMPLVVRQRVLRRSGEDRGRSQPLSEGVSRW